MITSPLFIIPENFSHSLCLQYLASVKFDIAEIFVNEGQLKLRNTWVRKKNIIVNEKKRSNNGNGIAYKKS
jgi:hypothetical protein